MAYKFIELDLAAKNDILNSHYSGGGIWARNGTGDWHQINKQDAETLIKFSSASLYKRVLDSLTGTITSVCTGSRNSQGYKLAPGFYVRVECDPENLEIYRKGIRVKVEAEY